MVSKRFEIAREAIADVYAFPANADVSIRVNDDAELVTVAIVAVCQTVTHACAPATLVAIFDCENDCDKLKSIFQIICLAIFFFSNENGQLSAHLNIHSFSKKMTKQSLIEIP